MKDGMLRLFPLALLATMVCFLFIGCAPAAVPTSAPAPEEAQAPEEAAQPAEAMGGGTVTWAVFQEIHTLDPGRGVAVSERAVIANLFEPLVWLAPDYSIRPGLATGWEASEDAQSYTFQLRDDVIFHDGTPFNADAVCFAYNRVHASDFQGGGVLDLLPTFESCEVLDDSTVRINLTEPKVPTSFYRAVSSPFLGIPSPAAVEEWGDDFGQNPVGTGPFMLEEWVVGDHITLARNPDYNWASDFFSHEGPAHLDELVVVDILEEATRLIALETDEAQVVGRVSFAEVPRLKEDPRFAMVQHKVPGMPQGSYLVVTQSPTDELAVRQAALYALDREGIIQSAYFGLVPPAYGPFSFAFQEYNPAVESLYSFDLDKASQLLEEAGWVDTDDDGVREKDGEKLHIVMISQPWALWQEPWGALLEQVGFEAEFVAPPVTEFREMVRNCATNIAPFGNNVSDPPQLKGVLHSEAVWGGPCHSDARLDELWEIGANEIDSEKRQAAWDEFQVRYMELALYAPIFPSAFYTGVSSQVEGLLFDGTQDIYFFYDVHLEP